MALTKIKTGSVSDSITLTTPTVNGDLVVASGNVGIGTASIPSSITRATNYLHIGGSEEGLNGYQVIGFGYNDAGRTHMPAYIGFKQTVASSGNAGALIFGTRADGSDVVPTERMRIDSNGSVGVGIANPSAYYADFRNLVLGNTSANSGMTIVSSTSSSGTIAFSDGTSGSDAYKGYIQYDHGANTLAFGSLATQRMVIDSSGRVTMPYQPAFQARKNASQTDIATNTDVTVTWQTEIFDQGANFASNTFTAPVTGKYQLNVHLLMDNVDSAAGYYQLQLKTSNSLYYDTMDPGISAADYSYQTVNHSVLADMDAGDTAIVTIVQSGGTSQSDLNLTTCVFSGYLVA